MKSPMFLSLVIGSFYALSPAIYAGPFTSDQEESLQVLNRNFYFYRDFRNGGANPSGINSTLPLEEREGYRNEWAHGVIVNYHSGYTDTPLEFGFDAYGLLGIKLHSDEYTTGTNLLEFDPVTGKTKNAYGEIGGALKVRYKDTVLRYGNQFPNVPVIATSTVRLLPSVATGLSIEDKSFDNLALNAGYFYSMNPVDSTKDLNYFTTDYAVGIKADNIQFLGGSYKFDNKQNSVTVYASKLDDVWMQYYLGGSYQYKFSNENSVKLATANYSNKDEGASKAGSIDTTAVSVLGSYQYDAHTFSLGYQQVLGDEPIDWVAFKTMGANVSLLNAAQYATFSEANEKSIQVKYEIDFSKYGAQGLSFMGRYLYGWDMDNTDSTNPFYTKRHIYDQSVDNKHWERNFTLQYKVQHGFAKGLDLKLRQATHRATKGYRYVDIDEIRFIVEYPLSF